MSSQGLENVPKNCGTLSQGLENAPEIRGTSSQGLENMPKICGISSQGLENVNRPSVTFKGKWFVEMTEGIVGDGRVGEVHHHRPGGAEESLALRL